MSQADAHTHVSHITSQRERLSADVFREVLAFRGVLTAFAVRRVKVKYKQAAVGIGWAVLQPVLAAAIFALILGKFAKVPSDGHPFLLFAFCGMVVWTFFASAAVTAMSAVVEDAPLLRKVYFPREILPLAAIAAGIADWVPALVTLFVVAALYGELPSLEWLALPLPLLLVITITAALGLGVAGLNVYYRDVRYALPFLFQLGLFVSAVIFPLSLIPGVWEPIVAIFNPIAGSIDAMRSIVLDHEWPNFGRLLASLVWSLLLLCLSYLLFKRLERGFADRV